MKLSVALLLLAAACSSSSSPPKAPGEKSGRAERLQIGNLEAYALEDGHLVVPNDGQLLGFGRPPSETAEVLAAAGLPRDTIRLDIQCLLVKAGDRVILFDTGAGNASFADGGRLPQSLALAGVQPVAVTDIFISHAHGDHVGGLVTKAGALAFPAATIHMSTPELRLGPMGSAERILDGKLGKQREVAVACQQLVDPMGHTERSDTSIVDHWPSYPCSSSEPRQHGREALGFG